MHKAIPLVPQQRQSQIRQVLTAEDRVSIVDLADRFAVSEMTIRRDLDKLAADGVVHRTHGGAVPADRMVFEFDFAARRQANLPQKQAIARQALKLVEPCQRIILDTGTTTLELAGLLTDMENMTVITPSLAVASVLHFAQSVEVVLLGGIMLRRSPDLTGVLTETNLEMLAADIAFQGADGIGLDGTLYNADLRVAKVDQRIRKQAQRTYVLADSSKINRTALAANGQITDVEALITDNRIVGEHQKQLTEVGGTIIVADS